MAGGRVCVVPVFGLGPPPSYCSCPSCVASPLLLFPSPPFVFSVTVLWFVCCVFVTGLCHCGIAVVICAGRKGAWCVVCGVHCQLFMRCAALWVVEWRWCEDVWSRRLSSSSLCLPLCVGVRGSARAAQRARTLSPNTIVFPCCLPVFSSLLFASLSAPRLSSPSAFPVIVEWRCVIHHVSVCCVGMTATGSLSRSSPFFW